MKTQSPSERTASNSRPAPDGKSARVNGNGNGEGPITEHSNGNNGHSSAAPTASAAPRTLPKRKTRPNGITHVANAHAPAAPVATETPKVAGETPIEAPAPVTQEPKRPIRAYITVENALWLGILVLAIVSRFWDVGNRALHHDESLHSVYAGNLYTSGNYQHDPMMHGPLQFHFIAFMYWLFDRTNATVRYASVLCGLFVVMSPFFLRKYMGRMAALICGFLLLVSPSVLYFSRMAREDAIFSGMEMIMLVGLWRFLATRKPMDFYIFCAGLSLMFTIKETAYLSLAIIGILFAFLFALQAGYAVLGALVGYLVVLGAYYELVKSHMPKLPDIPVTNPDYSTIMNFAGAFLGHPLVLGAIVISAIFVAALSAYFIWQRKKVRELYDPDEVGFSTNGHSDEDSAEGGALPVRKLGHRHSGLKPNPEGILSHFEPGSLPYIVGSLFARPVVLLIGFGIFASIFIIFYSVFFTDVPRGILSGMFASLGYWIAQQGVARGGQPWFYYFLLLPLYEPLAVFFSVVGGVFFSYKGIRWLFTNRWQRIENEEPRLGMINLDRAVPFARFEALFPLFLAWWLVGALAIYSWAGEKMPWLMMHMARPAIYLASVFLGALAVAMVKAHRERLELANGTVEMPVVSRSRRAAGVAFSLQGVRQIAGRLLKAPQLAYETNSAPNTVQYRQSGNRNVPQAPPRRGGKAMAAAIPMARDQDPPWIALNNPGSVAPFAIYLTLFMLLAFAWALSMTQLTHWAADGANTAADKYASWWLTWLYPLAMIAMTIGFAIWLGVGRSLRYLAVGILSVMLVYEFHSAIQLTYRNPDVATELAVYVQTSPDVTRVMKELDDFSNFTTGGKNVKVIYDSAVSWPMEWYLRDYPNKQFVGDTKPTPGADVPVMMLDYKYLNDPDLTKNYTAQRYALRWWFPEEWYKGTGAGAKDGLIPNRFAKDANGNAITDPATQTQKEIGPLGQVGDALHTAAVTIMQPEYQATLWKYLVYKEPPKPLGSTDFVLFVRKDVAQEWHQLQNEPIPSADLPVQLDRQGQPVPSLETVP